MFKNRKDEVLIVEVILLHRVYIFKFTLCTIEREDLWVFRNQSYVNFLKIRWLIVVSLKIHFFLRSEDLSTTNKWRRLDLDCFSRKSGSKFWSDVGERFWRRCKVLILCQLVGDFMVCTFFLDIIIGDHKQGIFCCIIHFSWVKLRNVHFIQLLLICFSWRKILLKGIVRYLGPLMIILV